MADPTQQAVTLLSHQAHTHATTDVNVVGTEQDVRTWISGTFYVYHANIETTANATGVEYALQARWSTGANVNEDWIDVISFGTGTTAAVAAEITGAEAAAETTIAVDADPTAAFTSTSVIYIEDKGTVADGEWGEVDHSTAGPDIVIITDGLTNAKDAADTMWTQAERFISNVDLSGFSYVRALVRHSAATGSNIHFKSELVAVTDFE